MRFMSFMDLEYCKYMKIDDEEKQDENDIQNEIQTTSQTSHHQPQKLTLSMLERSIHRQGHRPKLFGTQTRKSQDDLDVLCSVVWGNVKFARI